MEIEDNRNKNLTLFKNIKSGIIFEYEGIIYMKIIIKNLCGECKFNAISLKDGLITVIKDSVNCRILNDAKLVINN